MSILKFLGLGGAPEKADQGDTDSVRRIAAELDRLDPDRARYIAAFAYILGRVAIADRGISDAETRAMQRIVAERGALPEAQAVMVVQMAKSQNVLFGGTEDFLVAREFARLASYDQKLALLECLFIVSATDHTITLAEDQEIAKVALELKIEHADVVRARLARREYLSVLQRPEEN
ncbi:MAG: TerB family tellurite resistance protein [Vicinamibacterales bacterium]